MPTIYTATLYIDNVLQGTTAPGTPPSGFTQSTIIAGQTTGSSHASTEVQYDDVQLFINTAPTVNVLGNSGFEVAMAANSSTVNPYSVDLNWHPIANGGVHFPTRENTNVFDGSWSLDVTSPTNTGSSFVYQDFTFSATEAALLDYWAYSIDMTAFQVVEVLFGWDRGPGTVAGSVLVGIISTAVQVAAWGQVSNFSPVSLNTWHHYQLYINTTAFFPHPFIVGEIRMNP